MKYISVILTMLMFVDVNFSIMFTNFGHIHLVILNWSSEHSSNKSTINQVVTVKLHSSSQNVKSYLHCSLQKLKN